jgi:ribosomal-protein-alanine N-acetyltransferase
VSMGAAVHNSGFDIVVDSMRPADLPAILGIERASFASPWPARAYSYEMRNEASHYVVLRCRRAGCAQVSGTKTDSSHSAALRKDSTAERGVFGRVQRVWQRLRQAKSEQVIGYGGFWTSRRRAHISTLAVAPDWRSRKLGQLLLLHMLDRARAQGMTVVTLEVRVTNHVAQNLYRKCGFHRSGVQRGYYRDNGEDALLMSTSSLTSPGCEVRLRALWCEVQGALGCSIARTS